MKNKIIGALALNIGLFLYSSFSFIKIGTANELVSWKFIASLIAVLGFGFFVFVLFKQLKEVKKSP